VRPYAVLGGRALGVGIVGLYELGGSCGDQEFFRGCLRLWSSFFFLVVVREVSGQCSGWKVIGSSVVMGLRRESAVC